MTNNYQLLEVVYTTVHDNYKTEYKINIIEQIVKSFDNDIPNRYKKKIKRIFQLDKSK